MDVLCYFGDLTDIFRKCHNALRDNGVFGFSVEKPDSARPWELHPYGHFVHSLQHLRDAAQASGFEQIFVKEMPLRRELNEERIGFVCLFRRR
jgi:predicted TPR repeat methyltransferase